MAKIPNTKNCNCLNNYGLQDEVLLSLVKYDIQVDAPPPPQIFDQQDWL